MKQDENEAEATAEPTPGAAGGPKRRSRSLRTALGWLIFAVLLPFALAGAAFLAHQWFKEREAAIARLQNEARTLRDAVDRELALDQAVLTALAASREIDRGDWATFHAVAKQAAEVRPGSWFVLVAADAQVVANSAVPFGTALPNFRNIAPAQPYADWQGRKIPRGDGRILLRALEERKPQVSGLLYGPLVKRPAVASVVPVVRKDAALYVLALSYGSDFFERLVGAGAESNGLINALLDGNGLIIARSPGPEKFVGQRGPAPFGEGSARLGREGLGETISLDGIPALYAYSRSNLSEWVIAVGLPKNAILAPAWRAVALSLAVLLGAALIGAFFGWRLWRRLGAPLAALSQQARALGHRQVDVPPTGIDELDALRESLLDAARSASERMRAEQARDRLAKQLQIAFDAAKMGWWQYDPATGLGTYDENYHVIFGVSGRQLTNEERVKLIHPDDRALVSARVEAALDPENPRPYSVEYRIRRADTGEERWVEAHGLATFDGDGPARRATVLVGMAVDITERKRADAALRVSKAQLELADRRKSEFLSMLSHELRNPLAAIAYATAILNRDPAQTSKTRALYQTLDRQTRQLARMVDDLLDVARITRGQIHIRKELVRLDELVHQAVADARSAVESRAHRLVVTAAENVFVDGDEARLKQVIANLLDNAVKYTEPGGEIALEVAPERDQAVIRVRDNGPGIDPALVPHVFDLFTQGPRTLARSEGGLGIGLTLVKTLVEMHGGRVDVESELGAGTLFTVRLPIAARPPAPQPQHVLPTSATGLRILVVEDNVDAATSLAELLGQLGNVVDLAHDGVQGLDKAHQLRPDAIVLDIGLPSMSGYEVCRAIRQTTWGKDVLIVALTGWGQEEDYRKSDEAGFDGHLVKPISFDALLSLLATLLPDRSRVTQR